MANVAAAAAAVAAAAAGSDDDDNDDYGAAPSPFTFTSRRSPFLCRHACVASSQPLASSIGVHLLRQGANAAETAIAMAAALAVTEPCSTGLGGDMFCLYYNAATKHISCINGSGRSPAALTRELLLEKYPSDSTAAAAAAAAAPHGRRRVNADQYCTSPHAVTVPGAAQGWQDLYNLHGSKDKRFTFAQLLEPAAKLAEEGWPVGPVTAHHWQVGMKSIKRWHTRSNNNKADDDEKETSERVIFPLTVDGTNAPRTGDVMRNPDLARVLRELGQYGAQDGFYRSNNTGRAIVETLHKHGGCLTMDDLAAHTTSTFPTPISADYRGVKLWQVPPNGQGIAALIALTGLGHLERHDKTPKIDRTNVGSAASLHVMMEMMRLGFADARKHVADAATMTVSNEWLLDAERIGQRAELLFQRDKAGIQGMPDASSCTISFQVVDAHGNAISFVNSNFMGFGTGIVPDKCGFTLQNRGFGFTINSDDNDSDNDDDDSFIKNHANAVGPSKQPYHTIIPGMMTHADTGELYATLSNMGANMQPQGHFQLVVDLVAADLDPQTAIDLPRFCIVSGRQDGVAYLEEGMSNATVQQLRDMGHVVQSNIKGHERHVFGRAQIIKRDRKTGVLWAGSDGRADGCAMGF
jgi:gamma-glutamyltranspeptidase / glutathione hydrolase